MSADVSLAFYGLYHLSGETVSAWVGGLDCGDYVVDSLGAIYVPLASDAGGLLTADYIVSLDGYMGENQVTITFDAGTGAANYTIPVVIGAPYTSQGQAMRPQLEADVKSPEGSGLGKTRRVHLAGLHFLDVVNVSIGTDFAATLQPLSFVDYDQGQGAANSGAALPATTMFTGVKWMQIDNDYTLDGQLAWQTTRPGPLTISAVSTFLETSEH